ncbi:MAG: hypothetical protein HXY47_05220 [Nitrospirae bacterium]|nr:hypothetical protein [Nitrospirota bacterium]
MDASKDTGNIPYLYRTGIYLWFFPKEKHTYSIKRFFSDNKLGVIKIPLDVDVFIPSKDMQELKKRLSGIDTFALNVKKNGGQVAILIHEIPSWLSSSTSNEPIGRGISGFKANISPPKDYKNWSELVKTIVNHFNNKLKLDAFYIIWTEPDLDFVWSGTEEEYFKLYKYAVLGAKSADPKAKVGGPAVSSWAAKRNPPKSRFKDKPFLYNFLEYCSKNGIEELGLTKIPFDFLVFHSFNNHPALWNIMVSDTKNWLKEFSFDPRTPLFVAEWSSWEGPPLTSSPYSSEDHDTEFVASYIIANLSKMNSAEISYHTFTTLFDPDASGEEEFTGNFGIFTHNLITKASYNSFRIMSMLEGNLLQPNTNDPFIYTIASKNKEKIFLIITNFIPTPKMYKQLIAEELKKKGYNVDELILLKEDIIKYLKREENKVLPEKLRLDLEDIIKKYSINYEVLQYRQENPVDIVIYFENIQGNKYKVVEYLIDTNHSNAFSFRENIKKALSEIKRTYKMKKITKDHVFNYADAINNSNNVKLEKIREETIVKNTSKCLYNLTLMPYSVMMLILQPEEGSVSKTLMPPTIRFVK